MLSVDARLGEVPEEMVFIRSLGRVTDLPPLSSKERENSFYNQILRRTSPELL